MKKVFKYRVSYQNVVCLQLPKGAQVIYFDAQNGMPYIWALIDTEMLTDLEDRCFLLSFTGLAIEVDKPISHVGSCQFQGDAWHLFEVKS